MNIYDVLKNHYGFNSFRPGQEEIINSIINGENVLAVLPTGAGKSLCYQIPALLSRTFAIVISPLIALMKDQVDTLNSNEIIAAALNSAQDFRENEQIFTDLAAGKIKLLYLAPERLQNIRTAERLKSLSPEFIFVDEAHCISEWGHSFRPSYRHIKTFCDFTGIGAISAFTATATPDVRDDIIEQLGLKDPKIFVRGFERKNLNVKIINTTQKDEKCFEILKKFKGSAIIYCSTRKSTEIVSDYLKSRGINCNYYHAGLNPQLRKLIQDDFIKGRLNVIAATNAFGMGIDKKDIRVVIHYNAPGSIENYYQEIGRAGRDGNISSSFMLYEYKDKSIQEFFIRNSHPTVEQIKETYSIICSINQIAAGSEFSKPISIDRNTLQILDKQGLKHALVISSLNILADAGYLKENSVNDNYYVIINYSPEELRSFLKSAEDYTTRDLLITLLKTAGNDIFISRQKLPVEKISEYLGLKKEDIIYQLNLLSDGGIIDLERPFLNPSYFLIGKRVHISSLNINSGRIIKNLENAFKKLNSLIRYVESKDCRFNFILKYFGENNDGFKCGHCDNCRGDSDSTDADEYAGEFIIETLREAGCAMERKKLIAILINNNSYGTFKHSGALANHSEKEFDNAISLLIARGIIKNTSSNTYELSICDIPGSPDIANLDFDYELRLKVLTKLRECRRDISKKYLQPPEMICPDSILNQISQRMPANEADLMKIPGYTKWMLNKTGEEFIEVISEFNIAAISAGNNYSQDENTIRVKDLIQKKYSLKEICTLTRKNINEIVLTIESLITMDTTVDISYIFSADDIVKYKNQENLGNTDLRIIRENTGMDSATIRLLRTGFKTGCLK